jgi:hypothetical protein
VTTYWRTGEGRRLDRYGEKPAITLPEPHEKAVLWLDGGTIKSGPMVGWLQRERALVEEADDEGNEGDFSYYCESPPPLPVTVMFGRDDDPEAVKPSVFDWAVLESDGMVLGVYWGSRPDGRWQSHWLYEEGVPWGWHRWPSVEKWATRNDPAVLARRKARTEHQRKYRAAKKTEEEERDIKYFGYVRCPVCKAVYHPQDIEWHRWKHEEFLTEQAYEAAKQMMAIVQSLSLAQRRTVWDEMRRLKRTGAYDPPQIEPPVEPMRKVRDPSQPLFAGTAEDPWP